MATFEDYAWFGLGGNLGDVQATFVRARAGLATLAKDALVCSRLYSSEPWGLTEQPSFINQVVGLKPSGTLNDALHFIRAFETEEGRERKIVWGPRTIDIDILLWPNQTRNDSELVVPHPRLQDRRFVLQPWAELAPKLRIPIIESSIEDLLENCADPKWVKPISSF